MLKLRKKPEVGVGVVVIQEGKVLLGKRKGSHGAGDWSFSGGHLEFEEGVEECAFRELLEETGLKALSLQLGPWTNDIISGKHYITLFAFVDRFEGIPALLEPHKCEGWSWFDWNDLPKPLFPPIRSLIQKIGIAELKEVSTFKKFSLKTSSSIDSIKKL